MSASCSVPIATLRASSFQLPWGSSVWARVNAFNKYGYSFNSAQGNGAVILTVPDAPTEVKETVMSRTATSITFTWLKGVDNGGAVV